MGIQCQINIHFYSFDSVTTAGFIAYMQSSCDENNNATAGHDLFPSANEAIQHNNSGCFSDGRSLLSSSSGSESSTLHMQSYLDPMEINVHPAYDNNISQNHSGSITEMENPMAMHSTKMETSNQEFEMTNFDGVSSIAKLNGE